MDIADRAAQPLEASVPSLANRKSFERGLKYSFLGFAIGLGALQAWAARHTMTSDGICYLDMADACLRHDWKMAVNGLRSPFYSLLLALTLRIMKISPDKEFAATHLANYGIWLAALASFEFFWRQLINNHAARRSKYSSNGGASLPAWLWWPLGYTLFTWSSLKLITVALVFPDQCVAAWVYLACGFLLQIRMGRAGWLTFIFLGAVLGFGYLTKSSMFPLAFVFLAVSLFAAGDFRKVALRMMVATAAFLSLGIPFIVALSQAKGRPTFGDSASLNYAWHVDGVPSVHWQGGLPPCAGSPKHPTRKIFTLPSIYEFANPVGGTYPPWFDPSYWNEGLVPCFHLKNQIRVLMRNARIYLELILKGGLLIAVLILLFRRPARWSWVEDVLENWFLLIPAVAAMAMYAPVHVEMRYVGPFVVVFWAGFLSGIRLPETSSSEKISACLTAIPIAALLVITSISTHLYFQKGVNRAAGRHQEIAEWLYRMGFRAGDTVAFVGFGREAHWARLARVRIVAELPPEDAGIFWSAPPSVKTQVIDAFSKTGVKAIIAEKVPASLLPSGWHRIDDTDDFAYILRR